MQNFIYDSTTCCLCNMDNNQLYVYQCKDCIDAAIAAGCLKLGQVVATPSSLDHIPSAGDADQILVNATGNGYMMVTNAVPGSYGSVRRAAGVTYTDATCTLNVVNLTATGCINGVCYSCYAQTCDVETAEANACCYTDDRESCIRTDICAYACCCAEVCSCCYFEGCFADCFDACIAAWWADHKGEVETSAQTDNNRLWIV